MHAFIYLFKLLPQWRHLAHGRDRARDRARDACQVRRWIRGRAAGNGFPGERLDVVRAIDCTFTNRRES
jgi:hypothetical protein